MKYVVVLRPASKMKQHAFYMEPPAPKSMVIVAHQIPTRETIRNRSMDTLRNRLELSQKMEQRATNMGQRARNMYGLYG